MVCGLVEFSTLFESRQRLSPTIWSSLMHNIDRARIRLKQSPKHSLHGPMNQSPTLHRAVSVHDLVVSGVRSTSQRSLLGVDRSQNIERYCVPSPHFVEHCKKSGGNSNNVCYQDDIMGGKHGEKLLTWLFQSEDSQTPGLRPSRWCAFFPMVELPIKVIGEEWWCLSLPLCAARR